MAETTLNDTSQRDSFGSIEGSVEKLAQGHAAKFAVYPDEASRGVPCYLSDEDEARTAGLWRKRVRVEGLLHRDWATGIPVSIRDVIGVESLYHQTASPRIPAGSCRQTTRWLPCAHVRRRGSNRPAPVDAPRMTKDTRHTLTVCGAGNLKNRVGR